jgi:protein ImuA
MICNFNGLPMIAQLRQHLLTLQRAPGIATGPSILPLGISAIDGPLGGGLMRGALHEIAASGEAHITAATGFALGLARLSNSMQHLVWIAEDMAVAESGVPHGAGLNSFGLAPERLVRVSTAHRRDLLWAMEEALRCRAVNAVIGEMRTSEIDKVAVRRLSLAAAGSGALALLLRAVHPNDASTAATRWVVRTAPSVGSFGPGAPRFVAQLIRNRRGPVGSWILEWSDTDEQFILAANAQPVVTPVIDRSHRQVA